MELVSRMNPLAPLGSDKNGTDDGAGGSQPRRALGPQAKLQKSLTMHAGLRRRFSFAKARAKALKEVEHKWADGSVKIVRLDTDQSEINASIKEKRLKRSLYYDLSIVFQWEGKSRLGRSKTRSARRHRSHTARTRRGV